jgi:tetratricopeptide (TPR) repeat protein
MQHRLLRRLAATTVLLAATGIAQIPSPSAPRIAEIDVPDELKSKVTIAIQTARSNKPAEALALFNEILVAKPDLFAIAVERGKLYQEMNDHAKAIGDFTSAIATSPAYTDAYFQRCLSHYQTASHTNAVIDCSKAIELNSNPFEYYYYRGLAHIAMKAWEKAASDLSSATERNNNHPEAHLHLARVYFETGQLVLSLREYTVAIQQRPGFSEAYKGRAAVKAALGVPAGAKEDLAKIDR